MGKCKAQSINNLFLFITARFLPSHEEISRHIEKTLGASQGSWRSIPVGLLMVLNPYFHSHLSMKCTRDRSVLPCGLIWEVLRADIFASYASLKGTVCILLPLIVQCLKQYTNRFGRIKWICEHICFVDWDDPEERSKKKDLKKGLRKWTENGNWIYHKNSIRVSVL